jgi:hypothetical protein
MRRWTFPLDAQQTYPMNLLLLDSGARWRSIFEGILGYDIFVWVAGKVKRQIYTLLERDYWRAYDLCYFTNQWKYLL